MLFKSLLVGLDLGASGESLTPGSLLALKQASIIGRKFGARVLMFHSQAMDEHWEPTEERRVIRHHGLSEEGRAALDAARVDLLENDIDARLVIEDEKAWLGMIKHVIAESIDLVVVSKRSHENIDLRKLGSVSTKLLRKCPCAVWAVKDHPAMQLKNILVATDLESCERKVLATGVVLAREWEATAHVLHAFQVSLEAQMCGEMSAFVKAKHDEILANIRDNISKLGGDPDSVKYHIGVSSPTHAIEEAVHRLKIDLVVMGSVGRGGVVGVLLGNTAERILGHLDCSLLVLKPDDFVCPITLA